MDSLIDRGARKQISRNGCPECCTTLHVVLCNRARDKLPTRLHDFLRVARATPTTCEAKGQRNVQVGMTCKALLWGRFKRRWSAAVWGDSPMRRQRSAERCERKRQSDRNQSIGALISARRRIKLRFRFLTKFHEETRPTRKHDHVAMRISRNVCIIDFCVLAPLASSGGWITNAASSSMT